ncbi:MAG TPA: hypothetical protein VIC71_12485 [Gammaproteobacteria bacterium]|jgi:hypothetical protein
MARIAARLRCRTPQGGDPDYPVEPGALHSGSVVARVQAPQRGVFAALDESDGIGRPTGSIRVQRIF